MSLIFRSLITAAVTLSTLSTATVVKRNDGPTAPPCSVSYTPYLYAGCYSDLGSPRALVFSPVGLNRQNMTVETCTAVCKGNNFRYAGIEYYGECYCGNSIRGPVAADNACTFPCTGNKNQTCGGNKLVSVYMDPTYPPSNSSDILDYTPEGCYTEGYDGRAVAFRQSQLSSKNLTTEACLGACRGQNFPLAATEYGGECYCGVVLGNGTVSAPDSDCSTKCAGDSTQICGGRSRLNLYVASDLMSTEPCSPFVLPPPIVKTSTTTSPTQTTSSSTSSTSTTSSAAATTTSLTSSSEPATTMSTSETTASQTSTYETTTAESSTSSSTTTSAAATTTLPSAASTSSISSVESSGTSTTTSTSDSNMYPTTTPESSTSVTTTSQSTSSESSTFDTTSTTPSTSLETTTSQLPTSLSTMVTPTTSQSASSSTTTTATTSQSTSPSSSTTPTTSQSTTTSSTTTKPTTSRSTTSSPTTTPTASKTTSSTSCVVTTTPTPTCEYGCGKWCSKPIPIFSDHPTCKIAVAECILQIADCFLSAGWPASLQCAKYQSWCQSISTYCGNVCSGSKCSKTDCIIKNPPVGGPSTTTSTTSLIACPATSSSKTTSSTSTTAPIPTVSSICVLPKGPTGSGYSNGNCVGGIQPPALTCNNIYKEFSQYPLKLYTSKESSQCTGYSKDNVPQACKDACLAQYNSCVGTYANGCKGQTQKGDQDSYDSAKGKCSNQYYDCLAINKGTSVGNRCSSFGAGWS